MGNGASRAAPSGESEGESVFSLSESLQAKIAQEYQNEQIIKVFGKQMEAIGEKKAEMLRQSLARAHLQNEMKQFRQNDGVRQAKLDQLIESKEAKFSDLLNAVSHDAGRLEKKYAQPTPGAHTACLTERTAIALACNENKPIEVPLAALESCINRVIAQSS